MAVNLKAPEKLLPVAGIRLAAAEAAIKKPGRNDLVVIELVQGTRVAGVFTRNAFSAAPVILCREILAKRGDLRALLINAGNANAATGTAGIADARRTMQALAVELGCDADQVLPFSTGVIGQRLPVDRVTAAIPGAVAKLGDDGWQDAIRAIMTTDTVPKGASRRVATSQGEVTVTGMAKGVGMISPDMATMLAFIATDAKLTQAATQSMLAEAVHASFNCVTVDGDTSTNDSCVLMATGKVGSAEIEAKHADYAVLLNAVREVCVELAQAVVRDGEGATKFITIDVGGAADESEARRIAYSVANSPLFKTAMFASDANWGRIVMAIGKAGVDRLDPRRVGVTLDDVRLIENGEPHPDYREERGAAVVVKPEFRVGIDLGRGQAGVTIWTCDLSYDYVKINAEYRT